MLVSKRILYFIAFSGGCMVSPSCEGSLRIAAGLMGIDHEELNQALLSRVMQTSKGGLKGTVIMYVEKLLWIKIID